MQITIQKNIFNAKIIEFIETNEKATIYHHPAWLRALEKSFGHEVYYLLIQNSSKSIDGILPLMVINSPLTGRRITSLPFSTYCDPIINEESLQQVLRFLKEQFGRYNNFEMRTLSDFQDKLTNFQINSDYCTHILELNDSLDKTFLKFHPTSVRASIRRAEKNNLSINWDTSKLNLKIFYQLELQLRKRRLLPPIPFNFFKNVFEECSKFNLISIPVIYKDKLPIAAGLILHFKDKFYLEYTASKKRYLNFYPNHKLFFEVIKKAHNSGAKYVDFGRTDLTNFSLMTFKEKWATIKKPIFIYNYPNISFKVRGSKSSLIRSLLRLNRFLPNKFLDLEGKFFYKHIL